MGKTFERERVRGLGMRAKRRPTSHMEIMETREASERKAETFAFLFRARLSVCDDEGDFKVRGWRD